MARADEMPETTPRDGLTGTTEALATSRMAAQVFDAEGRLVWVSEDLRRLVGAAPGSDLGIGCSLGDLLDHPIWRASLDDASLGDLREELRRRLDPSIDPEPLWSAPLRLRLSGRFLSVRPLGVTVRAPSGAVTGTALIYEPALPARVVALLAEGDEAMFTRMAGLTEPGPRPVAILFADLDSSGPLASRLSSAAYFELIRGMTTAFDDLVNRHGGIVGKHAGDGASAFFLTETDGDDSVAAEAAITTASALPCALRDHLRSMSDDLGLRVEDGRLNVGVHWGTEVFIGQVVTGGRLEVTGLGNEVNECARLEQTARGGQILASRALVERLDDAAADRLGLRVPEPRYVPLSALATASKATRDAGSLLVTEVGRVPAGAAPAPDLG